MQRSAASDFYEAISTLARAYQFRDRETTCYGELSVTECYALELLEREAPLSVSALGRRLFLDKSSASRTASALEAKGLVARAVSRTDTRAHELRVTRRGQDVHGAVRAQLEAQYALLLDEYPPEVRVAVIEILGRLRPGGTRNSASAPLPASQASSPPQEVPREVPATCSNAASAPPPARRTTR